MGGGDPLIARLFPGSKSDDCHSLMSFSVVIPCESEVARYHMSRLARRTRGEDGRNGKRGKRKGRKGKMRKYPAQAREIPSEVESGRDKGDPRRRAI